MPTVLKRVFSEVRIQCSWSPFFFFHRGNCRRITVTSDPGPGTQSVRYRRTRRPGYAVFLCRDDDLNLDDVLGEQLPRRQKNGKLLFLSVDSTKRYIFKDNYRIKIITVAFHTKLQESTVEGEKASCNAGYCARGC